MSKIEQSLGFLENITKKWTTSSAITPLILKIDELNWILTLNWSTRTRQLFHEDIILAHKMIDSYQDVEQVTYNSWKFKSKKDIDQFLILYYLKCQT